MRCICIQESVILKYIFKWVARSPAATFTSARWMRRSVFSATRPVFFFFFLPTQKPGGCFVDLAQCVFVSRISDWQTRVCRRWMGKAKKMKKGKKKRDETQWYRDGKHFKLQRVSDAAPGRVCVRVQLQEHFFFCRRCWWYFWILLMCVCQRRCVNLRL